MTKEELQNIADALRAASINNQAAFFEQVAMVLYSDGSSSELVKLEAMMEKTND